MIVLAFPTQFEAQGLLRRLDRVRVQRDIPGLDYQSGFVGKREIVVMVTGMGPEQSMRQMNRFIEAKEVQVIILAGFAGALTESVHRGQILIARDYSNEALINYIRLVPGFDIASVHPVAEPVTLAEEKRKLGEETGCQMVDMETAYLSDLAARHQIEFMSIRAISDLVHEDLPQDVLDNGYDYEASKTTPGKMAFYLLTNPKRIRALKEFVKPLPQVRDGLGDFLYSLIEEL